MVLGQSQSRQPLLQVAHVEVGKLFSRVDVGGRMVVVERRRGTADIDNKVDYERFGMILAT